MGNFLSEQSCFCCETRAINASLIFNSKIVSRNQNSNQKSYSSDKNGIESSNGDDIFIGEDTETFQGTIKGNDIHPGLLISSNK